MHGNGNASALERLQRANQFLGGIEALRRVAQSKGDTQCTGGHGLFNLVVNPVVVAAFQTLGFISSGICPQHTGTGQHANVDRQRLMANLFQVTVHGGSFNAGGCSAGNRLEIREDLSFVG